VVEEGLAVGCATFVALNPAAGDQLYEIPDTAEVPIVAETVLQVVVLFVPAFAVGIGQTSFFIHCVTPT
jgi:hypothetical protein